MLSVDFIEKRISVRFRSTSISSGTVMDSFNVKFVAWLVMNQQVGDVRIWRRAPWTELGPGVRYTTPANAQRPTTKATTNDDCAWARMQN